MENVIRNIIEDELSGLIKNLNKCFYKRYMGKEHNFLLSKFEDKIKANMVFVSCFESQIGNRMENICRRIVSLKYNVPKTIPNAESDLKLQKNKQYILTNINQKDLHSQIDRILSPDNTMNKNNVKDLLKLKIKKNKNIEKLIVDLAYYDEKNILNIFEIKSGGMLDSSKAKGDLTKLLGLYVSANDINANVYFATIYNFNGEGNNWDGSPARFFEKDLLLIGKDFWNKILPNNVDFDKFKKIYDDVFEKLEISNKMSILVNDVIK